MPGKTCELEFADPLLEAPSNLEVQTCNRLDPIESGSSKSEQFCFSLISEVARVSL